MLGKHYEYSLKPAARDANYVKNGYATMSELESVIIMIRIVPFLCPQINNLHQTLMQVPLIHLRVPASPLLNFPLFPSKPRH